MRPALLLLLLALAVTSGCGDARPPGAREPNPLEAPPVDTSKVRSADEVAGWALRREDAADLDGDDVPERVILACDVTVNAAGAPIWEDGHRWALVIEAADGRRTLAYAAFLPHGFVEAALLAAGQNGTRRLLVQERSPQQQRALEIEYHGPGDARSSSAAHYAIERWLPGAATLPQ